MEAAPCDEPHSVELIIWSAPLLEGTMSIDAAGKIVDVSLGAAVLFGYRESELLSNDVTCLMKSKVARHHPTFLARFKDVASRRMVGTRRIVEAMHRCAPSWGQRGRFLGCRTLSHRRHRASLVFCGSASDQ